MGSTSTAIDAGPPVSHTRKRDRSDGLRLTRPGLWFGVATGIALLAAINTGNNGLFLAASALLASWVLAHLLGVANVRGLEVELLPEGEFFAQRLTHLPMRVANPRRRLPAWWIVLESDPHDLVPTAHRLRRATPRLVSRLTPGESFDTTLDVLPRRRGRQTISIMRVSSLFPLGIFRKGRRIAVDTELLIYPEIYSGSSSRPTRSGRLGEETSPRRGAGHDLYGLRAYQQGDDPRSIHWKQSARQRRLIFQERQIEESRRLMIVLDNAVGPLESRRDERRFERLVSEAATAAVDFLDAGFEV
ncbi:MAG: DUF58 domain-containing protein, partial [Acidobacteriota bacterium]